MAISAISAISSTVFVPLVQPLSQTASAQPPQTAQTNQPAQTNPTAQSNLVPSLQPAIASRPQLQLSIQQEILSALEQTLIGNLFTPSVQPQLTVFNPTVQSTLLTTFQLNSVFSNASANAQSASATETESRPGVNLAALFNSLNEISNAGTLLNTLA